MVIEFYQKNPDASQRLQGAIYEEKIINFLKSKIKLNKKTIQSAEAEKVIEKFNKSNSPYLGGKPDKSSKDKVKSKKISKK